MGRPPSALLSPEAIVAASFRLVDEGRSFGMRQVARELSVSTPSLYNHVDGLDALIELMRASLGADVSEAGDQLDALRWDERIRRIAIEVHAAYSAHPRFLTHLLGTPISSRGITARYEVLADAIAEAGLDDFEVRTKIDQIDSLALGAALELLTTDDIWKDAASGGALDRARRSWTDSRERLTYAYLTGIDLILDDLRSRAERPTNDVSP